MDVDRTRDALLKAEIEHFLNEYQKMEIQVPSGPGEPRAVRVHVPYMMQSVTLIDRPDAFARLKERHRRRLLAVREARQNAPAAVQAFLQEQFCSSDGGEKLIARGRADARQIRRFLQAAVDRDLVAATIGSLELRAWLKRYGVGVDCSAFVQHALIRLLQISGAAAGVDPKEQEIDLGFVRSHSVYCDVAGSTSPHLFIHLHTPAEIRTGDVLVKPGHLRLVAGVERTLSGAAILHLIESTSAVDVPCGQVVAEDDIGPRRLQIRYPRPERPIGEQVPGYRVQDGQEFQEDGDERLYVLGRLLVFNR